METQNTDNLPVYTLQVFSPILGKGLDREYVASEEVQNESNYIELGLIITGQDGKERTDLTVTVECTDASQNKTINGAGTYSKLRSCKYYPFHYEFHVPGLHVVTFRVGDESAQVGMNVR